MPNAMVVSITELPPPSGLLQGGFIALSLALAATFALGARWAALRTGRSPGVASKHLVGVGAAAIIWMGITGALAARGMLHFEPPRTMLPVFPVIFVLCALLAFGPLGTKLAGALPIAALVGFQGFRVLVELLLHRAYVEGLMPVQMSFSGRNFDIVSGVTAIVVAIIVARQGAAWSRTLVLAWNLLGSALLLNILAVALLSAPTPMRVFMNEPANVWVTQFPWVWLPTVMVFAAITGHLLVFRRSAMERASRRT